MKNTLSLCLPLLMLFATGCVKKKDEPYTYSKVLVESEQAFCQASIEKGMRAAFLTFLADDAIVFRPTPVNGKEWYREQPASKGVLTWEPVFAEISRSGDLGYTTGPWEYRSSKDDTIASHGHYVSVWRKQPDGSWRVAIDVGSFHPKPATKEILTFRENELETSSSNIEFARQALLEAEEVFSNVSASEGLLNAFQAHCTDDIRFYPANAYPIKGKEAVHAELSATSALMQWQPAAAELATSCDLGYIYGTAESLNTDEKGEPVESSSYLRIWRKQPDGTWKIALNITNPIPPTSHRANP